MSCVLVVLLARCRFGRGSVAVFATFLLLRLMARLLPGVVVDTLTDSDLSDSEGVVLLADQSWPGSDWRLADVVLSDSDAEMPQLRERTPRGWDVGEALDSPAVSVLVRRRGARAPPDLPAVFMPAQRLPTTWTPLIPGGVKAVEMCSGLRAPLSRALSDRGVPCFPLDYQSSSLHDLLLAPLDAELRSGVAAGRIRYLHLAPPCNTFSAARFPKVRSQQWPRGVPQLSPKNLAVVNYANALTDAMLDLAGFAVAHGCLVTIENPNNSSIWNYPAMMAFFGNQAVVDVNVVDYCVYGEEYKKPTKIISVNLPLPSVNRRCPGGHEHVRLSGWRSFRGQVTIPTARGTAEYPLLLCACIAADVAAALA